MEIIITASNSSFVLRGKNTNLGTILWMESILTFLFSLEMSYPDDPQRSRFKRVQEKVKKDIEHAFGAFKRRW